jgi:hypothetical protein
MQASYKHTVKEIQQEANTFFKTKDKGRGSGYKQYKRWEYHDSALLLLTSLLAYCLFLLFE